MRFVEDSKDYELIDAEGGEVWKLEECAADLIKLVTSVLSDQPLFFLVNSYTTGLSPAVMQYILLDSLPKNLRSRAKVEAGETCIPVTDSGLLLPSGASVRAEFSYKQEAFCACYEFSV